jgi:hypothetical protein
MAYTTEDLVRSRSGVTTSEVSSSDMTNILAWADTEIDNIIQDAYYYCEFFKDQGDERVIVMNNHSTVSDFIKVEIEGCEVFEEDKIELMENGDAERLDTSATGGVEYWTTATGTSATYTHSNTAHTGRKSLQITPTTEEDAYWETTDDFTANEPEQGYLPAYKFTCYIKTDSVVAGTGNGAYIEILWYDSSGTLLATDSDSANAMTGTNGWTKKTISKYAPDNVSYVRLRCVHDGSGGDAYFDTMKCRRVNWVGVDESAAIDMLKYYPHRFIAIWYSKTDTINPLIQNLATDLAARAALVHASGGSVQGLSYEIDVLKVNKGKQSQERLKVINQLTSAIAERITRLREQGLLKDNEEDWVIGLNTYDKT